MYIAHVFLLPVLIGTLIALHLFLVSSLHHTQYRCGRRTEKRLIGVPSFPGQAPRSLGLMFAVFASLFLLGGLVQINPIWIWGPYHLADSTNGAQPDWYLGWLIGALRLMPGFDVTIAGRTVIPNPFWGGVLFPSIVFGALFVWPALERRLTRDRHPHNLLDRPRDAPHRTGIATAILCWVFVIFMAGSADRAYVLLGWSYQTQIEVYRVLVFVAPVVAYLALVRRVRRQGGSWPAVRTAAFVGAVVVLAVATSSAADDAARRSLAWHMTGQMALLLVVPPAIVLARPLRLVGAAL